MESIKKVNLDFLPFGPTAILQILKVKQHGLLLILRENNIIDLINEKSHRVIDQIGVNSNYIIKKMVLGLKDSVFIVTMNGDVLCYDLFNPSRPFSLITVGSSGLWSADYFVIEPSQDTETKSNDSDMSEEIEGDDLYKELLAFGTDDGSVFIYKNEFNSLTDKNEKQDFSVFKIINNFGDVKSKVLSCQFSEDGQFLYCPVSAQTNITRKIYLANIKGLSCVRV